MGKTGVTIFYPSFALDVLYIYTENARGASKKSSKGLKMGKLIPLKVNPR